jgi:CheY-like chemotaxis protein
MPITKISKLISDTLFKQLKGAKDVLDATIQVTSSITLNTLNSVRGKRTETQRIADNAIEGAIQAGSKAGSDLGSVAKGAVIGTMQGVGEVSKVTTSIIRDTVRSAIKGTSDVGGDIAIVTKKAVEGAIEAGKQAGIKAEDAASAGAIGAITAANELGDAVLTTVVKTLSVPISGVRIILDLPAKKPQLLIVNGNKRDLDLLSQQLGKEGYRIYKAASVKELSKLVSEPETKISLAIVDVSEFKHDIWDQCKKLRKHRIPFLVIAAKRSQAIQKQSIEQGASGVLTKPLGLKELVEHIHGVIGSKDFMAK